VPVWVNLAQPTAEVAEERAKSHGHQRGDCGRWVQMLLLGVVMTCTFLRLASAIWSSLLVVAVTAACGVTGMVQLLFLAWACQRPQSRLVLETRRSGSLAASEAPIPALELKPCAALGDSRCVKVDTTALKRLGSGESSAHFEVVWREQSVDSPCSNQAQGALTALGEQPISVDGWIVPRGERVELFDGSQISLLTEQEKGRYTVSLIMGARFVTGSAAISCLSPETGVREHKLWPSACGHRLKAGSSALVQRLRSSPRSASECNEQPSIAVGRSVSRH